MSWGPILWLALASHAAAAPREVAHAGTWLDGEMLWEVAWTGEVPSQTLRLAVPLPAGAEVIGGPDGVLLGLSEDRATLSGVSPGSPTGLQTLAIVVPTELGEGPLYVPFLGEGRGPQRVTVEGVHFRPARSTGLEKHVSYWAQPDVGSKERRAFERSFRRAGGERARTRDQALYLRATSVVVDRGGIPGRLHHGVGGVGVQLALGGILAALLALGLLIYRGLEGRVRAERNRVYIDRNFEADPPTGSHARRSTQ